MDIANNTIIAHVVDSMVGMAYIARTAYIRYGLPRRTFPGMGTMWTTIIFALKKVKT